MQGGRTFIPDYFSLEDYIVIRHPIDIERKKDGRHGVNIYDISTKSKREAPPFRLKTN